MAISLILFIITILLLTKNLQKYFVYFFVYAIWLEHFQLWGQSVMMWTMGFAVLLFFLRVKKPLAGIKMFPMAFPFLVMMASLVLCNHFAAVKHYPSLVSMLVIQYVAVFIFWSLYQRNPQRVSRHFIKAVMSFAVIVGFYSLFETLTRTNPIVNALIQTDAYTYDTLIEEIRFGLKRSQGVFSMHTTNGGGSLLLFLTCYVLKRYNYIRQTQFNTLVIALLFATVFFTGARSAIAALVCILPICLDKRYLRLKYILPLGLVGLFALIALSGYLDTIIGSFVDTEKVNGSNSDMRENQFNISLYYMLQSPIVGNGISYTFNTVKLWDKDINGAESIWFTTMINQGILGIIAVALYFLSLIRYCFKRRDPKMAFMPLAFLIFYSLSSVPCVEETYVFIFLFMLLELRNKPHPS